MAKVSAEYHREYRRKIREEQPKRYRAERLRASRRYMEKMKDPAYAAHRREYDRARRLKKQQEKLSLTQPPNREKSSGEERP